MFIVIDGPDGSGKTTLAKSLTQQLCREGVTAVYTSEPTRESDAGEMIHKILQSCEKTNIYTFADLFLADRKEHLANFIEPCLYANKCVVCDRYKYSALAYQQFQGIDPGYLIRKNNDFLIPDYIFILLPQNVDVLIHRIVYRGQVTELFEKKETLTAIIPYYCKMKDYFPGENIQYLNAENSTEDNLSQILGTIDTGNRPKEHRILT